MGGKALLQKADSTHLRTARGPTKTPRAKFQSIKHACLTPGDSALGPSCFHMPIKHRPGGRGLGPKVRIPGMNRCPDLRDGASLAGCVTSDTCGPPSGLLIWKMGIEQVGTPSQGFRGAQEMSDLVTNLCCFGFKMANSSASTAWGGQEGLKDHIRRP